MVTSNDLGNNYDLTKSSDKKKQRLERLDKLMRYDEEQYGCGMRVTDRGEYVQYDSVKRLIESL